MASKARSNKTPGCLSYPGGKVICRQTKFAGAMRKYANWVMEAPGNDVLALDMIATRRVAPMGGFGSGGLVIRKHRA